MKRAIAHDALRRVLITFASREIHSETFPSSAINRFADSGNGVGSVRKRNGESNMIKKLLGVVAMAAVGYSTVPASAAHMEACRGDSLAKTEFTIEAMADGEGKKMAQKEVALAQTAMLDGKMGACASHLGKAVNAETMK